MGGLFPVCESANGSTKRPYNGWYRSDRTINKTDRQKISYRPSVQRMEAKISYRPSVANKYENRTDGLYLSVTQKKVKANQ